MSEKISLKEAERKVFQATMNDGLVDICLGCFCLMFILAPYLSPHLGDFWSAAVFVPFWLLVLVAALWIRKYVVTPRAGTVRLSRMRTNRLIRFNLVILFINILALVLGAFAAATAKSLSGFLISLLFGFMLLLGFSVAAYFLESRRLFIYGILTGLAFPAGEWLYQTWRVPHHGIPMTFGIAAAVMFAAGFLLFLRFLHGNPLPADDIAAEDPSR